MSSTDHFPPLSLSTQGGKRQQRRDFGPEAARDNVWTQDKAKAAPPPGGSTLDRSTLYSEPFAEYYKGQVRPPAPPGRCLSGLHDNPGGACMLAQARRLTAVAAGRPRPPPLSLQLLAANPSPPHPTQTTQGVVPEGEWDAFIETLRRPLPTTFRINGSGAYAEELRVKLESDFFANFAAGPIYVSLFGRGVER